MKIDGTTIGSMEPRLTDLNLVASEDVAMIQDGPAVVANRRVRTAPAFVFDWITDTDLAVLLAIHDSNNTWHTVQWLAFDWDDLSSWHGRVHYKCRFTGLNYRPLPGHPTKYEVEIQMEEALESTT